MKKSQNYNQHTNNLRIELPVRGVDIPKFSKWVIWNKFSSNYLDVVPYGIPWHNGFDFAAYITSEGTCILGLPEKTPVRAVDNGLVRKASPCPETGPHTMDMLVEHPNLLVSGYTHVVPQVKVGSNVKKGDIIATLYKYSGGKVGNLVHLHFYFATQEYLDGEIDRHLVDPEKIFGEISDLVAEPQGHKSFLIPQMSKQPLIEIANFRDIKLWERPRPDT